MPFIKRKELWELRNKAIDHDILCDGFDTLAHELIKLRKELEQTEREVIRWRDIAHRADALRVEALKRGEVKE